MRAPIFVSPDNFGNGSWEGPMIQTPEERSDAQLLLIMLALFLMYIGFYGWSWAVLWMTIGSYVVFVVVRHFAGQLRDWLTDFPWLC
jgi:hypothetical protein